MCGLFGAVGPRALTEAEVRAAHALQCHRGPDATGEWSARVGTRHVTLGHQRLSILDLSAAGTQPMRDAGATDERMIVFNGEIYNYVELREELRREGESFRTRTDTEVMLAAMRAWGLRRAHERFNGMWAFAYVDAARRQLVLSRDRAGEKPLYYATVGDTLYFASEIKTLLALSGRRFAVNASAAARYLDQSLLDTDDETFFRGIHKVPAAHFAVVDLAAPTPTLAVERYWTPPTASRETLSLPRFIDELRSTLDDSVRIRMRSDVPVGVLLSGGLDSSAIAAAMARVAPGADLNLLSAVSDEARYDESPFIDRVAAHLDRPVHRVRLQLGPDNAIPLLERASWHNDEPVGSFGNIAHFLLMERAKALGITVIMSGQGADELLCGYKKYLGFHVQCLVRDGRLVEAGRVLMQFARTGTVLSQFRVAEARRYLPRALRGRAVSVRGEAVRDEGRVAVGVGGGSLQMRQVLDLERFSVPTLCHTEDRMSMAHSREIRLPYLDVRLMDLLLAAPADYKLRDGWTKYALRMAVADSLPREITWRKDKQGFVNPQARWLRDELRPVLLDFFGSDSLIFRMKLVDRATLLSQYDRYCRGGGDDSSVFFREIFSPLALEIWMRQFEPYLC